MFLLDAEDRRVVFNDNRDDYLETPFIEHTFEHDGTYYIKPDQDRGFGASISAKAPCTCYGSALCRRFGLSLRWAAA